MLRVRDRGSNPGRLVGGQESCRWTNPAEGGRRGSRTLKAHRSPGFEPGAVAHSACPSDRQAPGAGIEPASSRLTAGRTYQHELHRNRRVSSRGGRIRTGALLLPKQADCQAFPHPESSRSPTSAQRESNPHFRHGKAVGYRYIMGTIAVPELSKSREHRVGLEPTSPHYGCGVLAAGRPVPASEWDQRGSNPHRPG